MVLEAQWLDMMGINTLNWIWCPRVEGPDCYYRRFLLTLVLFMTVTGAMFLLGSFDTVLYLPIDDKRQRTRRSIQIGIQG